jgi:two-component system, LytTR family, response regulator
MIRTLVVDDEALARVGICRRLADWRDFEVIGEARDGPSAVTAIRSLLPDLVFLDVQLPELDGFEVLELVGHAHLPVVVFVTAYDRFAVKAFETHALDYLLKPVSDARFSDALQRVRDLLVDDGGLEHTQRRLVSAIDAVAGASRESHINESVPRYIERFVVKDRRRFFFVKAADVDWFASASNYVQLHTIGHSYLIRMTMGDLEEKLDPTKFARIHRSTIVNIDRVKEVLAHEHDEYVVILLEGTPLRMGRAYRHRLLR